MIYTDKTWFVADTLEELHDFAYSIGVGRNDFESNSCRYWIPKRAFAKVVEKADLVSTEKLQEIGNNLNEYIKSNPLRRGSQNSQGI